MAEGTKKRFFGIHLGGGKIIHTAMVIFDVFEDVSSARRFVVDVFKCVSSKSGEGADVALLKIFKENEESLISVGVDAPLNFPPCIFCELHCPGTLKCEVPEVQWLRNELQKRIALPRKGKRLKPITPYSERPVDVYLRRFVPEGFGQIALGEALGSSMAVKAARIHYLKKHFHKKQVHSLVEVNPTISLVCLRNEFDLSDRDLKYYRDLNNGAAVRMRILDRINEKSTVFLYEKDLNTLVASIPAFYAFICAYTAYLQHQGKCLEPEGDFPAGGGWVAIPG